MKRKALCHLSCLYHQSQFYIVTFCLTIKVPLGNLLTSPPTPKKSRNLLVLKFQLTSNGIALRHGFSLLKDSFSNNHDTSGRSLEKGLRPLSSCLGQEKWNFERSTRDQDHGVRRFTFTSTVKGNNRDLGSGKNVYKLRFTAFLFFHRYSLTKVLSNYSSYHHHVN